MAGGEKSFRDCMADAFALCGDWFRDNAESLADTVAGGCTHWDITFSWDTMTENPWPGPYIHVNIDKIDKSAGEALIKYK